MRDDAHDRLLAALEGKLPGEVLDTWIRPLRVLDARDTRLELSVPNKFFRQQIELRYLEPLQAAVEAVAGPRAQLVLTIDRSAPMAPPPIPPPTAAPPDLDPRYSFETFVVGSSNQFAQAACLAVAETPVKAYNPLFIYGGVGLGKTHLLQAIGQRLAASHPHFRIQYLSSEKFTNDLIAAIRHDKTSEFRHRYRTIDLLLIDDIQFLSGKERTQEEFFHTYEDLMPKRQVVLSSDRSPKEIPDLEERLRSRFLSGMSADIQPPEFETRVAILKKKAELDRVALPDDVAYFIANRVKSNIRELEGSLVRIRAFCNLTGRPLTLDLAQEVLASIWGAEEHLVTIDDILRRVAEVFHVKPQDLRAKTRTKAVAFPRQLAMYLARQLTSDSYADIGRGFGGKDHTTVLHAVNKIDGLLQQDPKLRRTLDHIINTIRLA
jgi:chromosomal replication initiator protein